MRVAETIVPIILVMLLGYGLHKRGFLQTAFLQGLNQFVYWLALPALIVRSLLAEQWIWSGVAPVFAILAVSSVLTFLIGLLMAKALRTPAAGTASFLQGTYRGNLALIGLPLLLFLGEGQSELTIMGILVLSPSILAYNVTSVVLFARLTKQRPGQQVSWLKTLLGLRTNPLILATLLGFFLSFSVGTPHPIVTRFLDLVGGTAAPLALLAIGATMATVSLSKEVWLPLTATLLKVAVLPILAWVGGYLAQLSQPEMFVLLLFAACPTAAASAILAKQMGGDEKMASCIVALTTACSMIPLGLVVAFYSN